jgi:hypothetical protein
MAHSGSQTCSGRVSSLAGLKAEAAHDTPQIYQFYFHKDLEHVSVGLNRGGFPTVCQ